jgi:hypothetical protein
MAAALPETPAQSDGNADRPPAGNYAPPATPDPQAAGQQ